MGNQQHTGLSESTLRVREGRSKRLSRLLGIVRTEKMPDFEDLEANRQFHKDCQDIWIQCKGNKRLYYLMKKARKKFLGRG